MSVFALLICIILAGLIMLFYGLKDKKKRIIGLIIAGTAFVVMGICFLTIYLL